MNLSLLGWLMAVILTPFIAEAQVKELWNLHLDGYTHNSSNYSSGYKPIQIQKLKGNDLIVISQRGTLARITGDGVILWQKDLNNCFERRLCIDSADNILITCGSELEKYDNQGNRISSISLSEMFSKDYLRIDALTENKEGVTYITGHFSYSKTICLLAIDNSNAILWKKKFKQDVAYQHQFMPPRELVIWNDKIFILVNRFTGSESIVYRFDLKGNNRVTSKFDYTMKSLKIGERSLYSIGQFQSTMDTLIFTEFDTNMKSLRSRKFGLPRNIVYERAIKSCSEWPPISKEVFERTNRTSYRFSDFEFLNENEILVTGNSFGKPLITKIHLDHGIDWIVDEDDTRYFKYFNANTNHYSNIQTLLKVGDDFLISGIVQEDDYLEKGFTIFINHFIRKIAIGN